MPSGESPSLFDHVHIRGVRFDVLGPVDRRLSAPVSRHGRIGCPVCATSIVDRHVGPFYVNAYYFRHLQADHYRCECGWVGMVPGQHVTRSPEHDGPVRSSRPKPTSVRIAGLSRRMGERLVTP